MTDQPTPNEQDSARAQELTELVTSLVEAAVHGAYGPVQSYAALKLALRSVELAIPPELAEKAASWATGLLAHLLEDDLLGIARQAIARTPTAPVLPPEIIPTLVESATRMLDAIPVGDRSSRYALAAAHMAERLVFATQKTVDEKDALFLDFIAIKRMIARMKFDVVDARNLSKGGDA
jgi:hypothetical protein